MNHFFIKPEQIDGDSVRIIGTDCHHIKDVFRMKPGDELTVSYETGVELLCRIVGYESKCVKLEIIERIQRSRELPVEIVLYQGLPKADKMETIIQKCVELGVSRIVPVAQARCVVKLDAKKEESRHERWQKIAESAAKQSKRDIVPEVSHVMSFKQALEDMRTSEEELRADEMQGDFGNMDDLRHMLAAAMRKPVLSLIAYEELTSIEGLHEIANRILLWRAMPPKKGAEERRQINIFIGPEGGYEPKEVKAAAKAGALPVSLGMRILRTETAGMALIAHIMLMLETTR